MTVDEKGNKNCQRGTSDLTKILQSRHFTTEGVIKGVNEMTSQPLGIVLTVIRLVRM